MISHQTSAERDDCKTGDLSLRAMTIADLPVVSRLGIASKASWGYSPELMRVFAAELSIEASALEQLSAAQVACRKDQILGYFTIRQHLDGVTELEHLFVHPEHFGKGIGRQLLDAALNSQARIGAAKLTVIADPHSAGFYERFGGTHVCDHKSSIPGRVIPVYEFEPSPEEDD